MRHTTEEILLTRARRLIESGTLFAEECDDLEGFDASTDRQLLELATAIEHTRNELLLLQLGLAAWDHRVTGRSEG